jgi:hypothetical protein
MKFRNSVSGLSYIRSPMEIREGSRHTFCFRVEIITNLTILFVSLYFKVPPAALEAALYANCNLFSNYRAYDS